MSGGYAHSFISSWAWLYGSPFASAWFSASSAFWAASLIDWSRCPAFSSARYTFGRCAFQCALILCSNIGTTPLECCCDLVQLVLEPVAAYGLAFLDGYLK